MIPVSSSSKKTDDTGSNFWQLSNVAEQSASAAGYRGGQAARFVAFGEVLLRLSPPGRELPLQSPRFDVAIGGAEANVAASLARLGHEASLLTVLPDHALGRAALGELRRNGVDTRFARLSRDGRMGLYVLTAGAGLRASEVLYDRAGSSFTMAREVDFDWHAALDGAGWLHLSGVTPALGPASRALALAALRQAHEHGLRVSFDCNYRARLWEAWNGDAAGTLRECAAAADLLFADERALAMILGASVPAGHAAQRFAALSAAAFAAMPRLGRIAATTRLEHSVDRHVISGLLATRGDGVHAAREWPLTTIVDRIGSGDAFAAGLLHGLETGLDATAALEFGVAAACLKHSIPGDVNLVGAADVEALLAGAGFGVRR
jgi:2-dehydro-3-deoxygluconokinase